MKTIKEHFGSVLVCLMEILTGILLLIEPIGFTTSIIMILGAVLTISGVFKLIQYFRAGPAAAAAGQGLMKGLLAVIGGVFCMTQSGWFLAAFPVLTILYGAVTLISGLFKVQLTVDMLRFKQKKWGWAALAAALTILAAVIILANPFSSAVVLWTFIAITLIVEAVFDVISIFAGRDRQSDL